MSLACFGNIWFHKKPFAAKWNAAERKVNLWKFKCLRLRSSDSLDYAIWYWLHRLKKKQESLWKCECQDHGERPNTQTKDLFVQSISFMSVFQIIHHLNCQKASVQNTRRDKPQLGAKYSCKTGLFHRFQPGNKISKIFGMAPIFAWNRAWRSSMCFPCQMLKLYQVSLN